MARKLYDEDGNEVKQGKLGGCLKLLGVAFIVITGLVFFILISDDGTENTAEETSGRDIASSEVVNSDNEDLKESIIDEESIKESAESVSIEESIKEEESESISIEESIKEEESIEKQKKDEQEKRVLKEINKGIELQIEESTVDMTYYIESIELDYAWRINANVTSDVYSMNKYQLDELETIIRGITQTNYLTVKGIYNTNIPTFHLSIYNNGQILAQTSMFDPSELKWY